MTLSEQINYQKEVIKHLRDLGCSEKKIIDDLLKYPEYSKKILDEAKRYETQQYSQKSQ